MSGNYRGNGEPAKGEQNAHSRLCGVTVLAIAKEDRREAPPEDVKGTQDAKGAERDDSCTSRDGVIKGAANGNSAGVVEEEFVGGANRDDSRED